MLVYVLSEGDHLEGRTPPRGHTAASPHDTQVITVPAGDENTMTWLADEVKARVDRFRDETGRRDTMIWALRIASHGNAGFMAIGAGLDPHSAIAFSSLSGYFSSQGPGIELWGCAAASASPIDPGYGTDDVYTEQEFEAYLRWNDAGAIATRVPGHRRGTDYPALLRGTRTYRERVVSGRGYRLLQELARAAQVNATAAFDTQFPEFNGDNWQWEGTGLLTVFPDGGHRITELS
ncbi:MAG TPA: hypothetical protein VFZ49_01740 [Pyrinomonadaceae bacterium]